MRSRKSDSSDMTIKKERDSFLKPFSKDILDSYFQRRCKENQNQLMMTFSYFQPYITGQLNSTMHELRTIML